MAMWNVTTCTAYTTVSYTLRECIFFFFFFFFFYECLAFWVAYGVDEKLLGVLFFIIMRNGFSAGLKSSLRCL
ncbi:hypothetical protein FN846DRAFT_959199, partial [Sphaerosporella brunnea]